MTNFAALVQSTLNAHLIPRFQLGNESWNPSFDAQFNIEQNRARALWTNNGWPASGFTAPAEWYDYYAYRTVQMSALVKAACPRALHVVDTQAQSSAAAASAVLMNTHAETPVYSVTDEFAVASYFVTEIAGGQSTAVHESWCANPQLFFDFLYTYELPAAFGCITGIYNWLQTNLPSRTFDFVGYEGGQQLFKLDSERSNATINNGYLAFQRDARMGTIYTDWLTGIAPYLTYMLHYHHAGNWYGSDTGAFGAQRYFLDTEGPIPKLDALRAWAAAHETSANYSDASLTCAVRFLSFYQEGYAP